VNIFISNFFLNKWKPDVLHHTFNFLANNFTVPNRVITIHDMIPERFQHRYTDIVEARKIAIKKATHIICVSDSTKNDLLELRNVDPKKISVIYNGPGDFDNFYINEKLSCHLINRPYLLYVGKRNFYKNFINFVKAFSISKKIRNNFMIVCFGSDDFSNFEKSKFIEFNIKIGQDIIHLSDNMENIYALYKNTIALIYPSFYEGFGMPPLEAMKSGCPVIVSDIKPLREILKNSAEFFDPNNIEDISYKIEKVIFSNFLSKDLIKKGFERSSSFSWKKTSEETFKIYKRLT
jgi:glycosyltransferase involved in cell wall biosynthesis